MLTAFISNLYICITSSVANKKQHMHFFKMPSKYLNRLKQLETKLYWHQITPSIVFD